MKKYFIGILSLLLVTSLITGCSKKDEEKTPDATFSESNTLLCDEATTYEEATTYQSGSITSKDVIIKNAVFEHDLIIEKSVGDGDVTLDSVKVKGKIIVLGGGENSVHIDNSSINQIESNRQDGRVRIVISENTQVQDIAVASDTKLEVSGSVNSLQLNDTAQGSLIDIQKEAKVNDIAVNCQSTLNVSAPLQSLQLMSSSTLNLDAPIAQVSIDKSAENTVITMTKEATITSLATESKVEVKGEGKLIDVITTNKDNVFGSVKAENTVVNANPIQLANEKEVVVATPVPNPTNKPVATPNPTSKPIPTVAPTQAPPVEVPSTPKPTPTPIVQYTVSFLLNGYTVAPQTVKKGDKVSKSNIDLSSSYKGSYLLWLDESGNIFDFNTSITSQKTLTGYITVNATNENINQLFQDSSVSAINFVSDIDVSNGFTITKDIALFGNNHALTIANGNAFTINNEGKFLLDKITVIASGKDSRGIDITYNTNYQVTLNSSKLYVYARGITSIGIEDTSSTERVHATINLNNSEIVNLKVKDENKEINYNGGRGISMFDSYGELNINNSKIYGFGYGINIHGDNIKEENDTSGMKVNVINSEIKAWGAFNIWGSYGEYWIKNSTLLGINTLVGGSNSFSTIAVNNDIYGIFDGAHAYGNKMTIEDSTITNYQTDASKLSGLTQSLIRIDCGLDQLTFKGTVNLVDTTDYLDSAIYLSTMETKEDVDQFLANNLFTSGATILSTSADGNTLPLAKNPYVLPTIQNASATYNEKSENIIVQYDLDNGFKITAPSGIKDDEALATAYMNLLMNGQSYNDDYELGNDIVLNYYYKDESGIPTSLKSVEGAPLVKNKLWSEYLNYKTIDGTIMLPTGTLIPNTYIGITVPDNKTWITATNPETNSVASGWLDEAKGHTIYIDILVVYENNVVKETVSVDIPLTVNAKWDGVTIDTAWYNNTALSFNLDHASQLAGLAKLVNEGNSFKDKTIILSNDIDLNNQQWTPIGIIDAFPFEGTFDGNNKNISNLKCIQETSITGTGLFGSLKESGVIKNVTINNAIVHGQSSVAPLVASYFTGNLYNCSVIGHIEVTGNYKVAGLAAQGYGAIENSKVEVDSSSFVKGIYLANNYEGDNVGGLVAFTGELNSLSNKIKDCTSNVNVEGTRKVGGLVGYLNYGVGVINSHATGNVSSNSSNDYASANNISIGGLIGEAGSRVGIYDEIEYNAPNKLTDCSYSGTVSGPQSDKIGLLLGYIRLDIGLVQLENCTWNTSGDLSEVGGAYLDDSGYYKQGVKPVQTLNLDDHFTITGISNAYTTSSPWEITVNGAELSSNEGKTADWLGLYLQAKKPMTLSRIVFDIEVVTPGTLELFYDLNVESEQYNNEYNMKQLSFAQIENTAGNQVHVDLEFDRISLQETYNQLPDAISLWFYRTTAEDINLWEQSDATIIIKNLVIYE